MTDIEMNEEWVMNRRNRSHGLDPIRRALQSAGDPQDHLRTVHIAGTNGKGSTTNFLKDILVAQGYRVGTFTSPHLIAHRDRIRINDVWISEQEFADYLKKFKDVILTEDLGMFEIDTLIAFAWMKDQNVDYALMETGLGGRLDNTNVIRKPELEIITTIGFDHMAILGDRIQQIANEKAGIIMPYSRCVCGYLADNAKNIISRRAARVHAALSYVPAYRDFKDNSFGLFGDTYTLGSDASYQKKNASLALYAAKMLGINIHDERVKQAMQNSSWLGRFETVGTSPRVVLDGAHNEEGVRALAASMHVLPRPVVTVFSALRDKPGRQMGDILRAQSDHLIVTEFVNYRADTMTDLGDEEDEMYKDYRQALKRAYELAGVDGTVLITGSLYFISIVREYLMSDRG